MPQSTQLCSPKYDDIPGCFDKEGLQTLAKIINHHQKGTPNINIHDSIESLRKQVFDYFKQHSQCQNSLCIKEWANTMAKHNKQSSVLDLSTDRLLGKYLKPTKPQEWDKKQNTWLNTLDINAVMKQYEDKYNDFYYAGAVPNDFDTILSGKCVDEKLCKINVANLYSKGIRKIGIIFNTDPSTKGGSHWISLFMSLENGGICYIDSTGNPPSQEVMQLMIRLQNQANQLLLSSTISYKQLQKTYSNSGLLVEDVRKGKNTLIVSPQSKKDIFITHSVIYLKHKNRVSRPYYVIHLEHQPATNQYVLTLSNPLRKSYSAQHTTVIQKSFLSFMNTKRHQQQNTECGVYSIFFLIRQIEGQLFHDLINRVIPDSEIQTFRNVFFNSRKHLLNPESVTELDIMSTIKQYI